MRIEKYFYNFFDMHFTVLIKRMKSRKIVINIFNGI